MRLRKGGGTSKIQPDVVSDGTATMYQTSVNKSGKRTPSTYGEPNGILRPAPKRDGLRECERGPLAGRAAGDPPRRARPPGRIIRLCRTKCLPLPTFLISGAKTSPQNGFVGCVATEKFLPRPICQKKSCSIICPIYSIPSLSSSGVHSSMGSASVPWRSSLETALLSGRSATGDFHPAKGID